MPELVGTKELILDQESINAPVAMQEQTRGQVAVLSGGGYGNLAAFDAVSTNNSGIVPLGQAWHDANTLYYQKVRRMRRHPTIKLVRTLSCASMAGAQWSAEVNADALPEAKDVINDLLPFQNTIMSKVLPSLFDFGWAPFEKVVHWDVKDERTKLKKLKPLLQDFTRIMVTNDHGKFAGFKQFNKFLALSNCMLFNQDVEGTYLYGESTMSAIEPAYDRWNVTDKANVQYDKKIAGAHWVIRYPMGKSNIDGVMTDNFDVAKMLLRELEGSGSIAVPSQVIAFVENLEAAGSKAEEAWDIDIKSAETSQGAFAQRLAYLDTLMVRGGEFPERSILEGQYGTKAEAGEHADFAVARMDFRNKCVVDYINWYLVNPLLRVNLGRDAENTAKIKVAPIADDKKDILKLVLQLALANPSASTGIIQGIDFHAVKEQLEVPSIDKEDNNDEHLNNMLNMLQQQQGEQQPEIDPATGQPIPQQPAIQGNPNIPPDQG